MSELVYLQCENMDAALQLIRCQKLMTQLSSQAYMYEAVHCTGRMRRTPHVCHSTSGTKFVCADSTPAELNNERAIHTERTQVIHQSSNASTSSKQA